MKIPFPYRRAALVAALVPVALAAGCMTASKRLEQGAKLEERGQSAEAARRYIDALRRDGSLAQARARLNETGALAIEQYLAESDAAGSAGEAEQAADVLLRLDGLRRDAAGVGVQLAVPGDYTSRRRQVLDAAIEAAVDRGAQLASSRRFGDALGRLDRAADRWQPSAAQRGRLNEARVATYVAWSEHEAGQGRFRAAYDVAGRAIASLGRDFPGAEDLLELQARALEEGTVRVAVLPVTSETGVEDALPVDWLREVEDELEAGAWDEPPTFIEVIDPREVRREMRRDDGVRRPRGGVMAAASLGRALGADLVVRMSVDSTRTEERDVRSERRTARLRTGEDTAYTVRSGRRELWARVRYDIVDVRDRRSVGDDVFQVEGQARFREPVFQGNWRQLMLSRDDQALFGDESRRDQRRQLWRSLTDEMIERVQRELFEDILRLVD
ncbi:hypothetical protein [Longimicrobium sp.]|jgi:tetratricopeptide (TPR) repeat protein|uniref:hypothetical protein n=1 Tax=Longimicrobium sp. TaxID=2029185 RepID=UPI002ED7D078